MDTQPIALPSPKIRKHPALIVATVLYSALIGWITLSSTETGSAVRESSTWIIRMLERLPLGISGERWEFLLNVGMFVPLGLLLTLVFGARFFWVAALAAIAYTLSIEGLQQFIPYRVPDPRDLVANGLGGVAGTLLGVALLAARRARARA
jgi:glycopeptide antibiotics resistance protein